MLGKTVIDRLTGFTGVVTGYVEYLTGCNQVLVQPKGTDASKRPDSEWFDVQRVTVNPDIPAVVLDNGATPGCDAEAPKR